MLSNTAQIEGRGADPGPILWNWDLTVSVLNRSTILVVCVVFKEGEDMADCMLLITAMRGLP